MNPGQNQILLKSSDRFGILFAENLHKGLTPTVYSNNISMYKSFFNLNLLYFHVVIEATLVDASKSSKVVFPNASVVLNSIEIPASFILQKSYATGKILTTVAL